MDDARVWDFETSLWTGDAQHYRDLIDPDCLMVLPEEPFVLGGSQAVEMVADTPRWSGVDLTDGRISRPQDGIIVIAYTAHATRERGSDYTAHCTSTYLRHEHDTWRVIQHQQTPPLIASAG